MDGYAVAAAATPGELQVLGDVRMGEVSELRIAGAHAMRIPTGGVLPAGADAVVPLEDAVAEGARLTIGSRVEPGENVVARGADMRRGEPLLAAGTRIAAPQAGALATLGIVDVPVFRRPSIAVLSSGDELIPPWSRPKPGQVRDSNRYAIAATLRAMGAHPRHYPNVGDEPGECERALAEALRECDAAAITGGSSVGERDRLPAAVASLGEPGVVVHGLRIRPGKPLLLGALGDKPILGLPGNPASALLVLEAVAAPIVAALAGAPAPSATVTARLAEAIEGRPGWTWYVPVALRNGDGAPAAHPLPLHSFSVSLTARADGYVVVGEREAPLPAGAPVVVHRFLGG